MLETASPTSNEGKEKAFTEALLTWFSLNGRTLPWRQTYDPYAIWISEIMLQQTQVPRVAKRFYPNFLQKYPTLKALAETDWETLYPFWRGLGFYRRGKNLLRAAQIIMERHDGELPKDIVQLQGLPGIGPYTAAAIMSFAWNEPFAAIDTNIERIVKALWPSANIAKKAHESMMHAHSSRDWNAAMMDLATALRQGKELPGDIAAFFPEEVREKFKPQRKAKPAGEATTKIEPKKRRKHTIEVGIACISREGRYLIQARPEGKSFTGRWEFPGGKRERGESVRDCVKREIMEEVGVEISVRPAFLTERHEFDRVHLVLHFCRCQIQQGEPRSMEGQKLDWVTPREFEKRVFLETNKKALDMLQNMRAVVN